MSPKWVVLLLILGALSACVTLPSGPRVLVPPGVGKPFDQFHVDETVCRQYAQQQMGLAPGQVATQHAASGAAVGAAIGAEVGAVIGPVTLSSTSAAPAHVAQVLQNPRIS